jgi:hypothetical protein
MEVAPSGWARHAPSAPTRVERINAWATERAEDSSAECVPNA